MMSELWVWEMDIDICVDGTIAVLSYTFFK